MRITTWNVNGMRAALRKGFADILESIQPDVLLLQEVRALPEQLPDEWAHPEGWHVHWHPAQKLGYAGTAVWSREPLEVISTGLDADDPEGRILRARVAGVDVVSVYLPSGSSGPERQKHKDAWLIEFAPWADTLVKARRPLVLGGDFNVAHTEKDLFYAKANENQSGFLPHEREWMSTFIGSGWNDCIRQHFGDVQGPYSWWSNRGKARELDRGWRIDYLFANGSAGKRVSSGEICRAGGLTVSDHAPVSIDLDV